MGHKKKNTKGGLSLHQQAYNILTKMLEEGMGRSKREDKQNECMENYIYTRNSYMTYWRHIKYFLSWMKSNHPEVTTLDKARKYVNIWLEGRTNATTTNSEGDIVNRYSAYTIQTEAAALAKLFHIKPDDPDRFIPPVRSRSEITRSRLVTKSDSHFSEKRNDLLIRFCKGTGLRREGILNITGDSLYEAAELPYVVEGILRMPESERSKEDIAFLAAYKLTKAFENKPKYYVWVREKGGKWRLAPVIGPDVDKIVQKFKETPPNAKVWSHIPKRCDVHSYRGDYAVMVYKMYARPIEEIPYDKVSKSTGHKYQGDVYVCRNEKKGLKLDSRAILKAEYALGHNTKHTFVSHYSEKI